MISKATLKFVRVAPRKLRQVIELVKGEPVAKALHILNNTNKAATKIVIGVINSAISNAKRIPSVNIEELYIKTIKVDEGPMLKRFKAAAMGRATMISKKMSHINVELEQVIKKGKGKR
jgi:large subunit ribosomal protein L22